MTSRDVPGEGLQTRWDDEPILRVTNRRDGPAEVELSFFTEPFQDGFIGRRTRLTFIDVWEYRWVEWRVGYNVADNDGALRLIEIRPSRTVAMMADSAIAYDEPGRILDGLTADDVRHFRISFDEHGTYDFLCGGLRIEHEPRRPAS
ncbi:MAG TPA: hypothetical protein VFC19_04075 [Candidatus Limnocylindrales bacterium]|nr:hypothetical protein [Candidatus Limnocylindrales bacterium]